MVIGVGVEEMFHLKLLILILMILMILLLLNISINDIVSQLVENSLYISQSFYNE